MVGAISRMDAASCMHGGYTVFLCPLCKSLYRILDSRAVFRMDTNRNFG